MHMDIMSTSLPMCGRFSCFFFKLEGLLIHTEEEEEKWISN